MTVHQSRKLRTLRKNNTINSPIKDNKFNLNSVQLNILRNCVSSHSLHQRQLASEIVKINHVMSPHACSMQFSSLWVLFPVLKAIFSWVYLNFFPKYYGSRPNPNEIHGNGKSSRGFPKFSRGSVCTLVEKTFLEVFLELYLYRAGDGSWIVLGGGEF
jgi:hypothetical protein